MTVIGLAKALNDFGKYFDVIEAEPFLGRYRNGTPALVVKLTWKDGTVEQTNLSINLGLPVPDDRTIFVGNCSEHEGIMDALEAAGIVEKGERVPVQIGYGSGFAARLTEDFFAKVVKL